MAKNLIKAMLKKMRNQSGQPRPPAVDGQQRFVTCMVIIIKNFSYINSRRRWPSILLSHLFQCGLQVLGSSLAATFFDIMQGCFGWDCILGIQPEVGGYLFCHQFIA